MVSVVLIWKCWCRQKKRDVQIEREGESLTKAKKDSNVQLVRAEAILRHTHYSFLGSSVAKGPLCLQAHLLIAMATHFYDTKTVNATRSKRRDRQKRERLKQNHRQAVVFLKIDFDGNQLSHPQCWGQIFILDHVLRTTFWTCCKLQSRDYKSY